MHTFDSSVHVPIIFLAEDEVNFYFLFGINKFGSSRIGALLRLEELATLRQLAGSANAGLYIDLQKGKFANGEHE
jgi:hypothetical protein